MTMDGVEYVPKNNADQYVKSCAEGYEAKIRDLSAKLVAAEAKLAERKKPAAVELLPCPFCGAVERNDKMVHVGGCFLVGEFALTDLMRQVWNRRTRKLTLGETPEGKKVLAFYAGFAKERGLREDDRNPFNANADGTGLCAGDLAALARAAAEIERGES